MNNSIGISRARPARIRAFEEAHSFDAGNIYARDLYLYGYSGADEIPEMETVFVLSLGAGDENDDVYNELRDQLGAFVETAVVEVDIDVDNEGF